MWPTWHTYVTPTEVTRSPTWYLVKAAQAPTMDGKRSGERVKGVVKGVAAFMMAGREEKEEARRAHR